MTFKEWLDIWVQSGHLADRGCGLGKYCMARIGDIGPYECGNVEIIPFEQNSADGHLGKKENDTVGKNISAGLKGRQFSEEHKANLKEAFRLRRSRGEWQKKLSAARHLYNLRLKEQK